jgi:hypothetical protein
VGPNYNEMLLDVNLFFHDDKKQFYLLMTDDFILDEILKEGVLSVLGMISMQNGRRSVV